jgi:serine/threonine-protein kinase
MRSPIDENTNGAGAEAEGRDPACAEARLPALGVVAPGSAATPVFEPVPGEPLALRELSHDLRLARLRTGTARKFDVYRLARKIGRGATGVVFEAKCDHLEHSVALKRMRGGDGASEAEVEQFLRGAKEQSKLRHPNIVPVLHVGRYRGRAFFTMPLLTGGSLAQRIERQRPEENRDAASFRAYAALMAAVARAVQCAHDHGLLHRDLKPANILLDQRGQPHISDFGLAIPLDRQHWEGSAPAGSGTERYMSPEQASDGARALTTATDVYGLGVVLYELLTGTVPFEDAEASLLRQRIAGPETVMAPRALEPAVPADLERVCLACLHKEPARRYGSAAVLAADLEAIAAGRPPSIAPASRLGRLVHRVRRNQRRYVRGAALLSAVLVVGLGALLTLEAFGREERAQLETNGFVASGQAGAVLYQLREYADHIQQAAAAPQVVALASLAQRAASPAVLEPVAGPFHDVFVVSTEGVLTAQWPHANEATRGRSYAFRDYFRGARELGLRGSGAGYVARAFRTERDGGLEFAVSAALLAEGRWVGVLVGTIAANSVFGKVRMQDSPESGRSAALLGRRDIDRQDPEELRDVERFVYLIHDRLARAREVQAPKLEAIEAAFAEAAPAGEQFALRYASPRLLSDYRDPVSSSDRRWLAAFAPVGGTGIVVVVQSPQNTLEAWFESRWGSWTTRTPEE